MRVKMLVGGDKLEYDVHEQLTFDPEYVFEELGKQPGQLAWWFSLLAMKEQEVEDFSLKISGETARTELAYRADADALAKIYGKVTEGVISSLVDNTPDLIALHEKLNQLRKEASLLKAMAKGFDSRSALLATSASAQKAEIQARLRSLIKKTEGGN